MATLTQVPSGSFSREDLLERILSNSPYKYRPWNTRNLPQEDIQDFLRKNPPQRSTASAEPQFTEAGEFGRRVGAKVGELAQRAGKAVLPALQRTADSYTQQFLEPTINLPATLANYANIGTEALAGAAGIPVNFGRFPRMEIPTFSQQEEAPSDISVEVEEPMEAESVVDNQRFYRVLLGGKRGALPQLYATRKEAEDALEATGEKGTVAGIKLSPEQLSEQRLAERKAEYEAAVTPKPNERQQRFDAYLERLTKGRMEREAQADPELYARYAAAEQELEEGSLGDYERRLIKENLEKGRSQDFFGKVRAKRASENVLNDYNRQLGLLKSAYTQARRSGDPLGAFRIQQYIQDYQTGVPKEMGARKRAAVEGTLQERMTMLQQNIAEKIAADMERNERNRRAASSNPDFNYSQTKSNFLSDEPIRLTL